MQGFFLCASLRGLSWLALSSSGDLSSDMLKAETREGSTKWGVGYDPWVEVQTGFKGLVDKNDLWLSCMMWHKIRNHSSQSCLCNKQIQSSIRIHKFRDKFELGFLLTVSNPFTNCLLDPSAIFLPCPELLSLWELPSFQLFNSNYF